MAKRPKRAKKSQPESRVPMVLPRPQEGGMQLEKCLERPLRLSREFRKQKAFFRRLRRATYNPEIRAAVQRLRDSVIRSHLRERQDGAKEETEETRRGLTIAVSGVRGDEGASSLAVLLTLSLGASRHNQVAYLDGEFNYDRFDALACVLSLGDYSIRVGKSSRVVFGFVNRQQPNVHFLRSDGGERSFEFFSDKGLSPFFDTLRSHFDYTVVNAPPFLGESSNAYVAPVVDRLYLVVSAGETRLADVDRCVEIAEETGIELSGVIVNNQEAPLWTAAFWKDYFF